ncbi:hypothetical protein GWI33_015971 [Rhynchophorus ferrugineus]|uniref:Lipase domain-containing protein n=1 Tax=Rhynchophorus ferrugineus TaxID=354439 RepID=A0A834M5F3_RHYFE|nr:hypothetical protein GWI33_015971 [Rhynchophorus ferrugineus]
MDIFGYVTFILGYYVLVSYCATNTLKNILKEDQIMFLDDDMEILHGHFVMDEDSPGGNSLRTTMDIMKFFTPDLTKDVKFTYFSRELPDGVNLTDKTDFKKFLNVSKVTKCVTHGWMSSSTKDTIISIRTGFLQKYDANIIVMDWSTISGNVLYPIPMKATPDIGKFYGTYLNYMVNEIGIKPEDIHLVGHSLGAHISGFAARELVDKKVARITGLDPALPGFNIGLVESGTLRKTDANFVDVIHSCGGVLGYKDPLGHVDVYPNGGVPPQPGCFIDELTNACSHGWSWKIFASSLVKEEPYIGIQCVTLEDAITGNCSKEHIPIGDPTPPNSRGLFYSKIQPNELVVFDVYDKH